ncbi:50S ribosomal protein L21 [Anaplasma phagocytophilum]|uniref:50S ribosomal protein L21 n=1 Tax=Anaplasma phagocytophilum TaxID=948 RepID=UPI00200DA5BB|nr:50S ribosomal protein L21 [Anaplasma phagocytophilum]UQD54640.1 50S ribosomal protein L21 [Anaplasma phagocytophilum]
MFAVVETGGKQYKVKEQDVIKVELLKAGIGEKVLLKSLATFNNDDSGSFSAGSGSVSAEVVAHCRSGKIIVFKKRRRKNYRRKSGHRQNMTVLRVVEVR